MVTRVSDAMSGHLAFAPRTIGDHDTIIKIAVDSFQFFLNCSTETVGTPLIRQVMKREMIHVAFDVRFYTLIFSKQQLNHEIESVLNVYDRRVWYTSHEQDDARE